MNKLTTIFVFSLLVTLGGCGKINRSIANYTGYSESCIDGVKYLQFPSGATVKYNIDGHIATCK